jgi:hypothetical protein
VLGHLFLHEDAVLPLARRREDGLVEMDVDAAGGYSYAGSLNAADIDSAPAAVAHADWPGGAASARDIEDGDIIYIGDIFHLRVRGTWMTVAPGEFGNALYSTVRVALPDEPQGSAPSLQRLVTAAGPSRGRAAAMIGRSPAEPRWLEPPWPQPTPPPR